MMNKRISIFLSFILVLLSHGVIFSQIKIEAKLDSAVLLMGRRTPLDINVSNIPESSSVSLPLTGQLHGKKYIGLLNDTIEISSEYAVDTLKDGGTKSYHFRFYIQAFDSGTYEIPAFKVLVNNTELESNALTLKVIPVKVKSDDQIDDFSNVVQPFEEVPEGMIKKEDNTALIVWLSILGLILLILIIFLIRNYKKTGKILPKKKPLSPYKQALKRLDKLASKKLWQKEKYKDYYTQLTDIVRRYLQAQFGIKTIERTSAEILEDVYKNDELSANFELLKSLLATSDYAKFAKGMPDEAENESSMKMAKEFIMDTKPIQETNEKGGEK